MKKALLPQSAEESANYRVAWAATLLALSLSAQAQAPASLVGLAPSPADRAFLQQNQHKTAKMPTPGQATVASVATATNTPGAVPQALSTTGWAAVAPLSYARSQHAAVALGSNIYVWGGYTSALGNPNPQVEYNSLEIYSTATNTSHSGAALPVAMRGQASAAGADGLVYSFGGANGLAGAMRNCYRYNPATNTWAPIAAMPYGEWEASAARAADGKFYVFGGTAPNVAGALTQIYNPDTNSWTLGAPMPTGRHGLLVVPDASGLLHVLGGQNDFYALSALTTHEVYNPATNTWATAAPLPFGLTQAGGTLGPDGNLYVVGGKTSYFNNTPPFYNTVYVYSPATNTWRQGPSLPGVLAEAQAVTIGQSLYTVAGTSGLQQATVYRTDLCERPVLTAPANQMVASDAGQCSARVAFAASCTGAPAASIAYFVGNTPITLPYAFPAGTTTVTATATNCGGSSSCTFTIMVQDRQAPVAHTQDVSVALVNGTATVTAAQVDNGSTDNCGIATRSVSPSTFSCANLGPNNVTLTVRDGNGNEATETATVTVTGSIPTPNITVVPASSGLVSSGTPTTLYLGYGPTSLTLVASGGATYSWSPSSGLSNATGPATVFTATTPGTFPYTVTATSASGCPASKSVVLTVVNARCGNKNDKVLVCHSGIPLCIDAAAVPAHLAHGDVLGACPASKDAAPAAKAAALSAALAAVLDVYPNPFTANAVLRFRPAQTGPAQILVYNTLGQLVATLYDGLAQQGQAYERTLDGAGLRAGLYTCRFIASGSSLTQHLVLNK